MAYRTGNYSAFYVDEPFYESNLGAYAAKDFVSYNLLRAWKADDSSFPFVDSHGKTYNVRDGSDWEATLKPRLHERLNNSKNIVLFLSSVTKYSRALREEIEYGINTCGLPVIAIYPEFKEKSDIVTSLGGLRKQVTDLWENLPIFRNSMSKVPTFHIPMNKNLIKQALNNSDFMICSKTNSSRYFFNL